MHDPRTVGAAAPDRPPDLLADGRPVLATLPAVPLTRAYGGAGHHTDRQVGRAARERGR